MRQPIYTISIFLIVMGCRDPFDFDYSQEFEPRVVIEGFISDRDTLHNVKVSFSTSINKRGLIETQFVSDADVRIQDDQGGMAVLRHDQAGIYQTTPNFRAVEGRSYQLIVTLANGTAYRSAVKSLPAAAPARMDLQMRPVIRPGTVNNKTVEVEGAQIYTRIEKGTQRHFYQWLVYHYYIFEADAADSLAPEKFCYVKEFDETQVLLLQDNPLQSGGIPSYQYEVDFIPNDSKLEHDFGFQGHLLTMNEEDFNYWDQARKLSQNSGSVFDAAPFSIEGNITDEASGEPVLGYFGVYREQMDRIFFSQNDLGFAFNTFLDCVPLPVPPEEDSCQDCRALIADPNLGTTAPPWWRN